MKGPKPETVDGRGSVGRPRRNLSCLQQYSCYHQEKQLPDTFVFVLHRSRLPQSSPESWTEKLLRVVQLLIGHSKLKSTVRYLGIDIDDALEIAEQTEV